MVWFFLFFFIGHLWYGGMVWYGGPVVWCGRLDGGLGLQGSHHNHRATCVNMYMRFFSSN